MNRTEGDAAYGNEGIMVGNDCYAKKIDGRSGKREAKEVCSLKNMLLIFFI